jgi:hypothetical protein
MFEVACDPGRSARQRRGKFIFVHRPKLESTRIRDRRRRPTAHSPCARAGVRGKTRR